MRRGKSPERRIARRRGVVDEEAGRFHRLGGAEFEIRLRYSKRTVGGV